MEGNQPEPSNSSNEGIEQEFESTYVCEFCSVPFTKKEDILLHFAQSSCRIQNTGRIIAMPTNDRFQQSGADIPEEADATTEVVAESENQQAAVSAAQILCTVDMILCEQGNKIFIAPDNLKVDNQPANIQQIISMCQLASSECRTRQNSDDENNQEPLQSIIIAEGGASAMTSTGAVVTISGTEEITGAGDQDHDLEMSDEVKIEAAMGEEAENVEDDDENDESQCRGQSTVVLPVEQPIVHFKEDAPFKCDVCGKMFKKASGLERHKVIHTRDSSKNFTCDTCGRLFTTMNRLLKHEDIHEKQREEEHRRKHEQQEIDGIVDMESKHEVFHCETCQKTFDQSCCLLEHERIHFKENLKKAKDQFTCGVCDKWFHAASHLARHEKSHDKKNTLICDECGESFSRPSSLMKHRSVHSNVKPFTCNVCGRGFMQSSNLTTHLRTHTKLKPYTCSSCGKTFSHSSSRVIHERTHTGEKPYNCLSCSKTFRQSGDLAKHYRSHTGEKPYQCAICSKSFSVQSNLLAHLRIHVKKNSDITTASKNPISLTMIISEEKSEDSKADTA